MCMDRGIMGPEVERESRKIPGVLSNRQEPKRNRLRERREIWFYARFGWDACEMPRWA